MMGAMRRVAPSRYWGCTKKIVYDSWNAAETACLALMDDSPTRFPVMAYRCGWRDHGWHIGHSPHVARAHPNHPARRAGYVAFHAAAPSP